MTPSYSYKESVKSEHSDEIINTYFVRPAAGVLVRILYHTSITPNHVTIGAVIAGCCAAVLYLQNTPLTTALAGVGLTLKDLLDSVDGQLARAKQSYSRAGRFIDSVGDFVVNALVFAAIGWILRDYGIWTRLMVFFAFWGTTLRISYHVYYQTSYLHLQRKYPINRISEDMRDEDQTEDAITRGLHSMYISLYGWQDRLMVRMDAWSKRGITEGHDTLWYGDRPGLRLSGFLGMGTELFLLSVCSLIDELRLYLILNIAGMNTVWLGSLLYRRMVLARELTALR